MKFKILMFVITLSFFNGQSFAAVGPGHVSGKITNITSISSGILVRVGANETPENCTSSQLWMEIKQERTAMVSMTLMAWTLGRDVIVYTAPGSSGYCQVTQVDPSES